MNNEYKFIDEGNKTIYEVTSPNKIIPEKNQIITVRNKKYIVDRVDETINFDNWKRNITIYLNNIK